MNQNTYETDELVAQYMEFHYGSCYFGVENYPKKCAQLCLKIMQDNNHNKALDLGCAVGRTSFELAKVFDSVVGVDLSKRFIECAQLLQTNESLEYNNTNEGELISQCKASLFDLDLGNTKNRVVFYHEDACNLKHHHKNYDLVFAGNLLDRLEKPKQFLNSIHNTLNIGGVLVLSSPYTLLTEFTARKDWLGGFIENGKEISVLDGINTILSSHFKFMDNTRDIPFVIRETQRKYQHTIAQLSSWKRII